MKGNGDLLSRGRVGGALLLAFCLFYAWRSQSIRLLPFQEAAAFHARTMPEILSVIGVGLCVWCILFPGEAGRPALRGLDWGRAFAFLGLMSLYGLSVRGLGFILATTLFLVAGFALLGERRPLWLLGVAVPLVVLFWLLMSEGLDVYLAPLPAGLGR